MRSTPLMVLSSESEKGRSLRRRVSETASPPSVDAFRVTFLFTEATRRQLRGERAATRCARQYTDCCQRKYSAATGTAAPPGSDRRGVVTNGADSAPSGLDRRDVPRRR